MNNGAKTRYRADVAALGMCEDAGDARSLVGHMGVQRGLSCRDKYGWFQHVKEPPLGRA